jgi:hypothetical protein
MTKTPDQAEVFCAPKWAKSARAIYPHTPTHERCALAHPRADLRQCQKAHIRAH